MIIFHTLCSKIKSQAFPLTAYREPKISGNVDYNITKQNFPIKAPV